MYFLNQETLGTGAMGAGIQASTGSEGWLWGGRSQRVHTFVHTKLAGDPTVIGSL